MRSFGHTRPAHVIENGQALETFIPSPVKARTTAKLGHTFGADWDKRLILTCESGDLITLRPERTGRTLAIKAHDLYGLLIRREAQVAQLAKARERKAAKELKRRFK